MRGEADKISAALKRELFAHIPVLTVANVRVHGSDPASSVPAPVEDHAGGHHHAPAPFPFSVKLVSGLLEIIDTPQGERMRLTVVREVEALHATVTIDRAGGAVETIFLKPEANNQRAYISESAPTEPHTFDAQLRLRAGGLGEILPFRMEEPPGHAH